MRIAISIGDPNGIGPEIAVKAAKRFAGSRVEPVLVGDEFVIRRYGGEGLAIAPVTALEAAGFVPGKIDARAGAATVAYVREAVRLVNEGKVSAIVACPQSETAINSAGIPFSGYAGLLAQITQTPEDKVFLMLVAAGLRIAHVTLHESVRSALGRITTDRVVAAGLATAKAVQRLGVANPRLGVFGINPHAGEGGLFGDDDDRVTVPAVARLKALGVDAHGPVGADVMLSQRKHDAYLAMFHDQGHIPVKLLSPLRSSALSIGTPVLFSSVGHGSAHDIAGKGIADPVSVIETFELLQLRYGALSLAGRFTIRVANTDIAFPGDPDVSILESARLAGYEMPYSCQRGACASCRGLVRSGEIDTPYPGDVYVLFCQARPKSDLEIVPREIRRIDPAAKSTIDAKVLRVTEAAADVRIVQLRFPPGVRARFKAGQYLDVILADGARRSFSMANTPQQSDVAVLHVRVVPGGRFSEEVLPALAAGGQLRVEIPSGDFWLRDGGSPLVFVASGTGFAPVKSIIEDALRKKDPREMVLYWGARTRKDLYLADLPAKWAAQYPQFRFVPVLSEPDADWEGRAGFVHRAVMEDFPSLAGRHVYACGVTAMVDAARHDFTTACALPPDDFFCDAFVTPADLKTP